MHTNIIVLAAGKGERFKDGGYDIPKPYIDVCGKPIIQHMTDGIPQITTNGKQSDDTNLWFAVRGQHQKYTKYLLDTYGSNIRVRSFFEEDIIGLRGGLDTAYQVARSMVLKKSFTDGPLYVLDCDNKFSIPDSHWELMSGGIIKRTVSILGYIADIGAGDFLSQPEENPRWSYIDHLGSNLLGLYEKDATKSHLPRAIGVFGFSSVSMFMVLASKILLAGEQVHGEYYMSQAIHAAIKDKTIEAKVTLIDEKSFSPLGIPNDVAKFIASDYYNKVGI